MLESLGYKVNERTFGDLKGLFSEDYKRVVFPYVDKDVVYSGAEHRGKPKLPNLTVLPNLRTLEGEIVCCSTLGHQHIQNDSRRFQEIYEFHGHAGLLLRSGGEARLYLLRPCEKAVVGTQENMTIFNFGKTDLTTIDYANPEINSANKDTEKALKTFVFAREVPGKGVVFCFNPAYYNELIRSERPIRDASPIAVSAELGESLFNRINWYIDDFEKRGIEVFFGSNIPEDLRKELRKPLLQLVLEHNKCLFENLWM